MPVGRARSDVATEIMLVNESRDHAYSKNGPRLACKL